MLAQRGHIIISQISDRIVSPQSPGSKLKAHGVCHDRGIEIRATLPFPSLSRKPEQNLLG